MWDGVVLNDKWLQIKAEKLDPRFHFLSLDRVPFVRRKRLPKVNHFRSSWSGGVMNDLALKCVCKLCKKTNNLLIIFV